MQDDRNTTPPAELGFEIVYTQTSRHRTGRSRISWGATEAVAVAKFREEFPAAKIHRVVPPASTESPNPSPEEMKLLRPCPFCGGPPHYATLSETERLVRCQACRATGEVWPTRAKAAAAWNKRPEVEELKAHLREAASIAEELLGKATAAEQEATLSRQAARLEAMGYNQERELRELAEARAAETQRALEAVAQQRDELAATLAALEATHAER